MKSNLRIVGALMLLVGGTWFLTSLLQSKHIGSTAFSFLLCANLLIVTVAIFIDRVAGFDLRKIEVRFNQIKETESALKELCQRRWKEGWKMTVRNSLRLPRNPMQPSQLLHSKILS